MCVLLLVRVFVLLEEQQPVYTFTWIERQGFYTFVNLYNFCKTIYVFYKYHSVNESTIFLQVNTDGDLIHEMDSIHKKPYELVIIGRHMETSVTLSVDSLPPPKRICLQASTSNLLKESPARNFPQCYLTCDSEVTSSERSVYLPIRNHFVFACVASDTHSQKPFLGGKTHYTHFFLELSHILPQQSVK